MVDFCLQFFAVAALVAVAAAAPSNNYGAHQTTYQPTQSYGSGPSTYQQSTYKQPAEPYQFDYAVDDHYSGAVFSQNESNDGNYANGYYSVNLPDGRIQTVKYTADQNGYGGYRAEVTYKGQARYDAYKPSYKPNGYGTQSHQSTYQTVDKPTYV